MTSSAIPGASPSPYESSLLHTFGTYTRLLCAAIVAGILWILVDHILERNPHPLYNTLSLSEILVAALVMLRFSFHRDIVHLLTAVLISVWYTLRTFVTYFAPETFEYSATQFYTADGIELTTRFIMQCSLAMLAASWLHGRLYEERRSGNGFPPPIVADVISFFGVRVKLDSFLISALLFTLVAALYRVAAIVGEFGIRVGQVYEANQWLLGLAQALSYPFYLLVIFSLCLRRDKITRRLSIMIIGVIVIDGIVSTSRGWLFAIIIQYIICACVLNLPISRRTKIAFACFLPLALLVVFPAMTLLRPLMLAREYFTLGDFFRLFVENVGDTPFAEIFLYSLNRFAGLDWLALWINVDPRIIPPNASLWGEVVDLINKFVPGEIITIPGSLQLTKLQLVIGGRYGYEILDELGGHGDIVGGIATFYIFFGWVAGIISAAVWFFGLLRLEASEIHLLHKAYLFQIYLLVFIIGGGFILMQTSLFWYLIISTLMALMIRLLGLHVLRALHHSRAI